jgi:hypothetical protein
VVSVAGLAAGVITGRTWTPLLSDVQWKAITIAAIAALLMSWALKVFVLGN